MPAVRLDSETVAAIATAGASADAGMCAPPPVRKIGLQFANDNGSRFGLGQIMDATGIVTFGTITPGLASGPDHVLHLHPASSYDHASPMSIGLIHSRGVLHADLRGLQGAGRRALRWRRRGGPPMMNISALPGRRSSRRHVGRLLPVWHRAAPGVRNNRAPERQISAAINGPEMTSLDRSPEGYAGLTTANHPSAGLDTKPRT